MKSTPTPHSNDCSGHECESIMKKVILALDGELSYEEEEVFLEEVNKCPGCLERFDIEKSFKLFLAQKIQTKKATPDCIQSIKAKIELIRNEARP